MSTTHFESSTQARSQFKGLLDAAGEGRSVTVRREDRTTAVVDGARLRRFLLHSLTADVGVVPEAGGWSAFLRGLPVAAEGTTFDQAMDELVDSLRDYADDWEDHLRLAPNHRDSWALVQLVGLCDDQQLRHWLSDAGR